MNEFWSLHAVRQFSSQLTLLNFREWLSVKAEAHERMQSTAPKPKADESKTKTKVFVSTAEQKKASSPCLVCKSNHAIWNCAVFKQKTSTQRAHVAASNQLCVSCLNGNHGFRKCPKPRKCAHKDCNSSHNTLLYGAERVFPHKTSTTTSSSRNTKVANQDGQTSPSTCAASVADLKGLLPIAPVVIQVGDSHSWADKSLAESLSLNGAPVKKILNGINSSETVDTEQVAVQITSDSHPDFSIDISPYVKTT